MRDARAGEAVEGKFVAEFHGCETGVRRELVEDGLIVAQERLVLVEMVQRAFEAAEMAGEFESGGTGGKRNADMADCR